MKKTPEIATICQELCDFVSSTIIAKGVSLDKSTLLSTLGVDSFSLIEIVLFIERKYGIVLSDETLTPEHLKCIESIANCTLQQLKDKA